jgi:hypothetical protein
VWSSSRSNRLNPMERDISIYWIGISGNSDDQNENFCARRKSNSGHRSSPYSVTSDWTGSSYDAYYLLLSGVNFPFRAALEPTQPPILWLPGVLSLAVVSRLKNAWSYTSIIPLRLHARRGAHLKKSQGRLYRYLYRFPFILCLNYTYDLWRSMFIA